MELRQIKELMAVMQRTGTKRLVIKKEGVELELEREEKSYKPSEVPMELLDENPMRQEILHHRTNMLLSRGADLPNALPPAGATQEDGTSTYITSPMVGTFYACSSPDDPPFIKVGDRVEKDTVVCIIEAMKVMNEVKAGALGVVAEVLITSGHPVEFGTKLFRITQV